MANLLTANCLRQKLTLGEHGEAGRECYSYRMTDLTNDRTAGFDGSATQ
jgi:hypothetical protein